MTRHDPLVLAADRLDLARSPEVLAAREVIAAAAAHAETCEACDRQDSQQLIPQLAAVWQAPWWDAEIDAAGVELARELERRGCTAEALR